MKCDVEKCKAECCGIVPIPIEIRDKFPLVRKPEDSEQIGEFIFNTDKDGYCCYLGEDFKCSIYDNRPEVCRKFGNEEHQFLVCRWQDKNGRVRSRCERRMESRNMDRHLKQCMKDLENKIKC